MSSRPSRGAARLAAILDALPDALVLVNANGTVVNANTIALEAFETPGTALVGRGLLDLLPGFDSKLIPGSMRRPDHIDPRARTKPTRMMARRTDGTEFPVEVTSANLENGQQAYDGYGYTGDELLMLVVRDLSGTIDTEAELARSQRQTEMILRAAAEGVVGTDTDGRIVLVNPAAAQILGYRASDLGGKELHDLVLHSRADGTPFPYDESPLADTLRSGRKHRVRGQVLWSKGGEQVSVDLTTAPVRDGDQLVGAVMTFTDRRPYEALVEAKAALEKAHAEELERLSEEHASDLTALRQSHVTELEELREKHAEELAAGEERYASLGEREKDRYEALHARYDQLVTLLGTSLRGPLEELRRELSALAADDAGQLWPEANQVLHHLSAGYARITTLIDNVLGYQRLDAAGQQITRTKVMLDAVVASGVDGAVELIGPGRVQFAVHAPPIEAEVDPRLLATALAHLVADVAGVDATGNAPVSAGGYMDNTVVVAAAQRGEVARIEVRGPYAGGDPVHEPIVRGIVRAHGGVLQTHEVPGMSGSAYVLEVPLGGGAGAVTADPAGMAEPGAPVSQEFPADGQTAGGGRRRARRSSTDAFLELEGAEEPSGSAAEGSGGTGRRRRRAAAPPQEEPAPDAGAALEPAGGGTGRRRRAASAPDAAGAPAEGAVMTADEHAAGTAAVGTGLGGTVPPQGVPAPSGRRARRAVEGERNALPPALPAATADAGEAGDAGGPGDAGDAPQPTGRRRRALAAAQERAAAQEAAPRTVFALPPADADRPADAAPDAPAEGPAGGPAAAVDSPLAPAEAPVPPAGHPVAPAGSAAVPLAGPDAPGAGVQPGAAQAVPVPVPGPGVPADVLVAHGRHDGAPQDGSGDHTPPQPHPTTAPTGRRRRAAAQPTDTPGAPGTGGGTDASGTAAPPAGPAGPGVASGAPVAPGAPAGTAEAAVSATPVGPAAPVPAGPAAPGAPAVPPQSAPVPPQSAGQPGTQDAAAQPLPAPAPPGQPTPGQPNPARPIPAQSTPGQPGQPAPVQAAPVQAAAPAGPLPVPGTPGHPAPAHGAPGMPVAPQAAVSQAAVPPQAAVAPPHPVPGPAEQPDPGRPGGQTGPGRPIPAQATGGAAPAQPVPAHGLPHPLAVPDAAHQPLPAEAAPGQSTPPQGTPAPQQWPAADAAPGAHATPGAGTAVPPAAPAAVPPHATGPVPAPGTAPVPPNAGAPVPPADATAVPATGAPVPPADATAVPATGAPTPPAGTPASRAAQPLPAEAPGQVDPNSTQGRAISVRTLGQGVPFTRQAAQAQVPGAAQPMRPGTATPPPHAPGGNGRRRKLGTPPDPATRTGAAEQPARPHPAADPSAPAARPAPATPTPPGAPAQRPAPAGPVGPGTPVPQPSLAGQARLVPPGTEGAGRSYAIGAPDENAAEGPEPLDGPGGAVEVADAPPPLPMDDELPPEPLDNPRRLLVWPAPDMSTQQALSDRGYRPVIVHSREEVDAQIAAFPAALFVDPLTGPITRTALQQLRQAAVAAQVPVMVTAGLGQASREAAYGADPAVLLKALAPRDSEQHPPRVMLIEEHAEIALALTATLERRGMQVARAASDADAVALAGQFRPNLVVMDLLQVHRRRAGIVDWLRANGQLNRTPLVVYTAAVDQADLPRLASGETVLFLAERSTSTEVQTRIVDLLARIGTN
ncbi:PAS domain-containing protein [Streptomyces sp. NPDC028635]|uniref:hybrid sensor histidine kinase/response regulator n=1 Tax=Streptomyces sp. NPDC028635 TaxID=3154800 RepID=UPI0033CF44AD